MNSDGDRISAYLGGVLTEAEAKAFEAELGRDPDLAAQLDRWRNNDSTLREAFNGPDAMAISDDLLARLGLTETSAASNVVSLDTARRARTGKTNDNRASPRWRWPVAGAIAAALVVAIGVSSVLQQHPNGLADTAEFQTAMSRAGSGTATRLKDARSITPVLSFAAADGRFCREFTIDGSEEANQGIACRANERWSIEALVKGGAALPSGNEIETAGGKAGGALAAAYDRLKADDPLNAEKEKALISEGWTKR